MVDSSCALPDTSDRSALLILPAMLVRRGKYSVADPLFVEERRPVLVARKLRRGAEAGDIVLVNARDRKSTRLNSSHANISYAVFCLKKRKRLNYSHAK